MPNLELINYIENETKRGVSIEAIQEALTTAGWQALEVADALRSFAERSHAVPNDQPVSTLNIVENSGGATSHNIPSGFIPKYEDGTVEDVNVESPDENKGNKSKHSGLFLMGIILSLIALLAAGYFFVLPIINDPAKKVRDIIPVIESARSIQYSGEYEITAPAGFIISDKILQSNFGGISARQATAKINGTFFGVDDWFDYKSRKNEVKFSTKINVVDEKSIDFSATSRLVADTFFAKLSESTAIFDSFVANQGANWVRFNSDENIPMYAYGLFGRSSLYTNGFARELASFFSTANVGGEVTNELGEKTIAVTYSENIVNYFNTILAVGDRLGETTSIGAKYSVSALTELPFGELTFDKDNKIKKATISFGYKTNEYTTPIHLRFTISYDRFDVLTTINIPSLVVPFEDLKKSDALSDLPETLKSYFSDIRTIASVYKGINSNSFKGLCLKQGAEGESGTELTVPFISEKILSSGFQQPICADTDTAWGYYTRNVNGYFCTDSRGFSGKVSVQPIGDKCN